MFLVGFSGTEVQPDHWIVDAITREQLGGVILFDRSVQGAVQNITSPEQLRQLTGSLQQYAEIPLFISVDQEGGKVCRLKARDGFSSVPSATVLGREDSTRTSRHAEAAAAMLAGCGINLNFAPVVDLDINPASPIISRYERSFGADPQQVVRHAAAFIEAHHRYAVGCCLKHFPGHGSAGSDSHLGFVDSTHCWQENELLPYRYLIQSGYADGIMTAHLVHCGLDVSGLPATLSPAIITGILRKKLGFNGVVFSDDLQMRAISDGWSYEEAVQRAILAGVDVLVVGNNLAPRQDAVQAGIRAVAGMLDRGLIDENCIRDSLTRIGRFKERITGRRPWKAIDLRTAW